MLDAAQRALAGPAGRCRAHETFGPAACGPAAGSAAHDGRSSRAPRPAIARNRSVPPSVRARTSPSDRAAPRADARSASARAIASVSPPAMNGERSNRPASVLGALARCELQHEQRCVDERIGRQRCWRGDDHGDRRLRARTSVARPARRHLRTRAALPRGALQIGEDDTDVLCAAPATCVARPVRRELELSRRVVGARRRSLSASLRHALRSRRRDPCARHRSSSRRIAGGMASKPAQRDAFRRNRSWRRAPSAPARASSIASRASQRRTNSRHQACSACASGAIECLQALERNQIVLQAPPAACGEARALGGIEQIARHRCR